MSGATCGYALYEGLTAAQIERNEIPLCGAPATVRRVVGGGADRLDAEPALIVAYLCDAHRYPSMDLEERLGV